MVIQACWTPDRVVQVIALTWNIALCPWVRHLTLTVPLLTQGVYVGTDN